jgi:hypothetical protein
MSQVFRTLRWLLLPLWIAQLFSGEKAFHANPVLGSRSLNRRGLHVWRGRLAAALAASRRRRLERLVAPEDCGAFARDGFVVKPDLLPPEQFERLLREVETFRGRAAEVREGDAVTRRVPLTPSNLKRLPACRALLRTPAFRGLTRYVSSFDVDPIVSIQTIFTKAAPGREDPQTAWHADSFHPTMKAWLFLQDVAEEDGPFCYAPGSHLRTARREALDKRRSLEASDPAARRKGGAFRFTSRELERLKTAAPLRLAVKANTLVVADTYGVHARGASAGPTARLEIWASTRRNPFLPWAGSAFGALLGARLVPLTWALVGLRRRLGLPTPDVRIVPEVGPLEPPAPWTGRRRPVRKETLGRRQRA